MTAKNIVSDVTIERSATPMLACGKENKDNAVALPLKVNSDGELVTSGGGGGAGASSVSAEYISPADFSAAYTSASTLTLSGLPIIIADASQVVYVKQIKADNTSAIYVNGAGYTITHSAGVLTVYDDDGVAVTTLASGDVYEIGLNGQVKAFDSSTNSTMVSPLVNVWNQYTDAETLVTAQDLTASYADFGAEIDMRGYTHLRVGIVLDVNISSDITMKLLGLNQSGGSDEFEIEGGTTQEISHEADNKFSYEFDVKGSPFVQIQAIAGTVGATAGDLTLTISKIWRS